MIKYLHLFMTRHSEIINIFRDRLAYASNPVIRFSKLNHQFSLIPLANKIWNYSFTQLSNLGPFDNPFILKLPLWVRFIGSAINKASNIIPKPAYQPLVSVNYSDPMIEFRAYIKSAFSINNSSKIDKLFIVPHINSLCLISLRLVKYSINFFKVQQQRLSGWDIEKVDVYDSPNLFERIGGGINKTSRHLIMVSSR